LILIPDELRKTALSPPFRLAELMRMAQAEMGEALDLISDLHDAELFYEDTSTLIASRPRLKPDLLSASFIAQTISSRSVRSFHSENGEWLLTFLFIFLSVHTARLESIMYIFLPLHGKSYSTCLRASRMVD
jgi:hypothetical protein